MPSGPAAHPRRLDDGVLVEGCFLFVVLEDVQNPEVGLGAGALDFVASCRVMRRHGVFLMPCVFIELLTDHDETSR